MNDSILSEVEILKSNSILDYGKSTQSSEFQFLSYILGLNAVSLQINELEEEMNPSKRKDRFTNS